MTPAEVKLETTRALVVRVPVMVSPVLRTLREAAPVTLPVTLPVMESKYPLAHGLPMDPMLPVLLVAGSRELAT